LIDVGAKVTVVSSSAERVDQAVKRLGANSAGAVGDVRDERGFTELLRSLSPVDHIIFSSVDKIIRGPLESLDLDDAKYLFGVKFWGAVVIGKGKFILLMLEVMGSTQSLKPSLNTTSSEVADHSP
jgi:hypothetical protein